MKCKLPLHDARDLHRLLQAAATLREHGRALEKAASHRRRLDYLAGLSLLEARILCNSLLRASDFLQKFLLQLPCPTEVEVQPPT